MNFLNEEIAAFLYSDVERYMRKKEEGSELMIKT